MIALAASKRQIRGDLRQPQLADQGAVWVIAVQPVMSSSPKPAKMIKADPVVTLLVGTEKLATAQRSMINIEYSDVVELAVDDEQATFVR